MRAPTPAGPHILWLLNETRSAPTCSISNGIRPAICVASQWNKAPTARTRSEISAIGFRTPVSLFAAMTDTSTTSVWMIASRAGRSTYPPVVTGMATSLASPCSSSQRAVSRTEACSTAEIRIRGRPIGAPKTAPCNARLLASVAPAVNTTFDRRPPTNADTCSRASSTEAFWRRPKRCTEDAFPIPS